MTKELFCIVTVVYANGSVLKSGKINDLFLGCDIKEYFMFHDENIKSVTFENNVGYSSTYHNYKYKEL